jgi:hypothetical protein
MARKEHLTPEGLRKIVSIRASVNKGLTDELKVAFPNTIPVPRPTVVLKAIPDPQWLTGFTDGEGCLLLGFPNLQLTNQVSVSN